MEDDRARYVAADMDDFVFKRLSLESLRQFVTGGNQQ